MKKSMFLFLFLAIIANALSQVAISTNGSLPDASAMLDVASTEKGLLIPRLTMAERDLVNSPAQGLLIYQTDNAPGFYFYDGSVWSVIGSESMSINGLSDGRTGGNCVFLGSGAGTNDDGSDNKNVGVGDYALCSNTTGRYNTANGYMSLNANTYGNNNTANGCKSLYANTYGYNNTANGYMSLYANIDGYNNTANGCWSLRTNTDGHNNTANGCWSLGTNTTGHYNTANGYESLYSNMEGTGNTANGYGSLRYNATGDYNTAVGYSAGPPDGSTDLSNIGAFGYNAAPTASNRIHIGNTSVDWIGGQVAWSTYSDKRFKRNIEENVSGLDFIMKLRPVTYQWDIHGLDKYIGIPDSAYNDEIMQQARADQEAKTYTGFLAQEVEQAVQETGFDFSGVQAPVNEITPYSLSYAEFVVPLVKAVQEQQKMIEELKKEIEKLKRK